MGERERRGRRDEQRVAVGRGARDGGGADIHAAAGDVLDHRRLAPFAAEPVGGEPRQDIGGRSRRRGEHELHGLRGVIVLRLGACPPRSSAASASDADPAHACLPCPLLPCCTGILSLDCTGGQLIASERSATGRRPWPTRSSNSAPITTRCSPRASRSRRRCRRSPRSFRSCCAIREFVAESFSDDTPIGKRTLHHDPDTDVYVLAHVYEGPKKGSPHSHGASWAVYGTARAVTEMTEWRRVNPESEERPCSRRWRTTASAPATPAPTGRACCTPREHPEKAWVIRVTGTDLDAIPRFRFRPKTDQLVEKV